MANNYDGVRKSNLSMEGKIKRWDEALPLGNGKFGALIWGDGSTIRISLDRADLGIRGLQSKSILRIFVTKS